jgi:hypothetical protein
MMKMDAYFSDDGHYRLGLGRQWDEALSPLMVCMLNPSTGDGQKNDPTISALIHFATLWGFGGLGIFNLYAFISSKPADLLKADDPVGQENGTAIEQGLAVAAATSGKLLVAWGNDAYKIHDGERADWLPGRARHHGLEMICLGKTASGAPKHPMARGKHRIPRDQQPLPWIGRVHLGRRWR